MFFLTVVCIRQFVVDVCADIQIIRTNSAHTFTTHLMIQFLRAKNFNISDNSSMFFTYLFHVKPPDDDLKVETCRSLGELM